MGSGYEENHVMLSKSRTLFLSEDITCRLASQMAAMLLYFDNEDHDSPIEIFINSDGGDIRGLFYIYDIMQMIEAPIKTICIGRCYSAAAVILAAGTKGERYAFKNSKVMIHGVQAVFPIPGLNFTDSKNYHVFLKENNENVIKVLSQHTGQPVDKIRKDCLEDVWMNSQETKLYGLIDHII
jgi:ATP-dependent Clp protease protease subunit